MKQIQALNDLNIGITFLNDLKRQTFSSVAVMSYIETNVLPYLMRVKAELEIKQKTRRS